MQNRHNAVLDVYAIVSLYPPEANALALSTQLTALAYLQGRADSDEVLTLLRLAYDLGYVDEQSYLAHSRFLQ